MIDLLVSYYKQHGVDNLPPPVRLGNSENLAGKRFGKLTVLYKIKGRTKNRQTEWVCLCDCTTRKSKFTVALACNLKQGRTNSCGCGKGNESIHFVTLNGKSMAISEAAEILGKDYNAIYLRVRRHGPNLDEHKFRGSRDGITYNGKTQSIEKWADEIGIGYDTLYRRVRTLGWSAKQALTRRIDVKKRHTSVKIA